MLQISLEDMHIEKEKRDAIDFGVRVGAICLILVLVIIFMLPSLDRRTSDFFVTIGTESGMNLMIFVSHFAEATWIAILSLIVILFLVNERNHKDLAFYLTNVAIGPLVAPFFKMIFERTRPNELLAHGWSFPSGHAATAMAIYGSLAFIAWPKYKWFSGVALAIPLLVGISRMYLNVHWLSDVFGGFFFGIAFVLVVAGFFYRRR